MTPQNDLQNYKINATAYTYYKHPPPPSPKPAVFELQAIFKYTEWLEMALNTIRPNIY